MMMMMMMMMMLMMMMVLVLVLVVVVVLVVVAGAMTFLIHGDPGVDAWASESCAGNWDPWQGEIQIWLDDVLIRFASTFSMVLSSFLSYFWGVIQSMCWRSKGWYCLHFSFYTHWILGTWPSTFLGTLTQPVRCAVAADWKSQVAISAGHDQTIRCPSAWVSVFFPGCKLERMAYNDLERFDDGNIRAHLDSKKAT